MDPFLKEISDSITDGLKKTQALLPVDDVDLVIEDNPDWAIPETGVGGQAPTAHIVIISINPLKDGIAKSLYKEITSTLTHELHHCARMKEIGYGKTLWEALVTEGLTAHFDLEVNKGQPKPWDIALKLEQIPELLKKAEEEYDNEKYNHSDWFFGREDRNIPRWTGYSLAHHIIGKYLKNNPGKTAAKLYKTPAIEFRDKYIKED